MGRQPRAELELGFGSHRSGEEGLDPVFQLRDPPFQSIVALGDGRDQKMDEVRWGRRVGGFGGGQPAAPVQGPFEDQLTRHHPLGPVGSGLQPEGICPERYQARRADRLTPASVAASASGTQVASTSAPAERPRPALASCRLPLRRPVRSS